MRFSSGTHQPSLKRRARRLCALAVVFGFLVCPAAAQDEDETFHLGVLEYEISCLPCHGVGGKGDGPVAESLDPRPSDLTEIARTNGGVFPEDRLGMVIDGRTDVTDHGPRAMPVWGERYRSLAAEAGIENAEDEVQMRIDALLQYIESLQAP